MKSSLLFIFIISAKFLFSEGSVIVLYGGSSAGKTSTSIALGKLLPGKWKVLSIDMFSNKEGTANEQLWRRIGKEISSGYNVIADTVSSKFLTQECKKASLFVVLMYCSPFTIIDHVNKRNKNEDKRQHRTMNKVLTMYCHKHTSLLKKNEKYIDTLYLSDIEQHPYHRKLKKLKNHFFDNGKAIAYITSTLLSYDYFINTEKYSINECAMKIKEQFCSSHKVQ
ncbi:hypothetical protein HYV11_01185 [Candidatus Dependentiae bacterium]|nr:hypothetical protein [Candidatus Dependentiae bacterium]